MSDSQKTSLLAWLLFVSGGLLLAVATGRLTPQVVPDSASYLDYSFASLDDICRSIRTIGYPLWLFMFKQTIGIQFVPAAQVIVHATVAWWLFAELSRWDLSLRQRLAAAIAIGVGCTPMDHIHVISTDAMAASIGVVTVTCVLRWARIENSNRSWLPVVIAIVVAVFVRPAYLFLIPWLFVAGAMLCRLRGSDWRVAFKSSVKLSLLAAVPIVGWMMVRLTVVSDFGMLPFGHQNLGAVLVQLVSDEELASIGDELGDEIVAEKTRFAGEVGFAEGEPGATMTINARWDDMTYFVLIPAAKQVVGDDTVAVHRAIAELNKKIIWRYPLRYAKWLVKAARQAAWVIAADIVMHPVFLAAIGWLILLMLKRAVAGCQWITFDNSIGSRALVIIALTYLIAGVGLVILTSPPIGRFSDAAAIFLPAFVAATLRRREAQSNE